MSHNSTLTTTQTARRLLFGSRRGLRSMMGRKSVRVLIIDDMQAKPFFSATEGRFLVALAPRNGSADELSRLLQAQRHNLELSHPGVAAIPDDVDDRVSDYARFEKSRILWRPELRFSAAGREI